MNTIKGAIKMENVVLNVQGMSCGHCVKAVEGCLAELQGINEVKVDLGVAHAAHVIPVI